MASARTGEKYLQFMQGQADIANGWATEDRAETRARFRPVEDRYIADAATYDSPERKAAMANEAAADVRQQATIGRGTTMRRDAALGILPGSGRAMETASRDAMSESLAAAGAANGARRGVEATADGMRANVINLGKGMAVNPATSLGLANQAGSAGFSGQMGGYGQQGQLLNAQFGQQMDSYRAKSAASGGFGQAIGSIIGAMPFMSTEKAKENRRPVHGILDAVKAMRVEKWNYKKGLGDGGEHIGTFAEDFHKNTGLGNPREISVIDAIGINMGAIKELAAEVAALGKKKKAAA
jgi:hypothetical protein